MAGVTAGGLTDSVIVNVAPVRPVVIEVRLPGGRQHLGTNDTITLRGYRMDGVTAANLNVAGGGVTITSTDSAHARVVLTTLPAPAGCGGRAPGAERSSTSRRHHRWRVAALSLVVRKPACLPAELFGQTGWVCDYTSGVRSGNPMLRDMLNAFGDEVTTARFVKSATRDWIVIRE